MASASEHVTFVGRRHEHDVAGLGDGADVSGVACEGEGGVGEREDETPVGHPVAVGHVVADPHRHRAASAGDRLDAHAEPLRGGVVGPHHVGAGLRQLVGSHETRFGWPRVTGLLQHHGLVPVRLCQMPDLDVAPRLGGRPGTRCSEVRSRPRTPAVPAAARPPPPRRRSRSRCPDDGTAGRRRSGRDRRSRPNRAACQA